MPAQRPPAPNTEKAGRPTLMTYGLFILVGCCLCASLVSSLL